MVTMIAMELMIMVMTKAKSDSPSQSKVELNRPLNLKPRL